VLDSAQSDKKMHSNKRLQPSKAVVTVLAKDLQCFATALQSQARAKHLCS